MDFLWNNFATVSQYGNYHTYVIGINRNTGVCKEWWENSEAFTRKEFQLIIGHDPFGTWLTTSLCRFHGYSWTIFHWNKEWQGKKCGKVFFVLLSEDNLRQFNLNNENSKSVSISTRFYPFKMKNTIDELICNPTLEIPCFFFSSPNGNIFHGGGWYKCFLRYHAIVCSTKMRMPFPSDMNEHFSEHLADTVRNSISDMGWLEHTIIPQFFPLLLPADIHILEECYCRLATAHLSCVKHRVGVVTGANLYLDWSTRHVTNKIPMYNVVKCVEEITNYDVKHTGWDLLMSCSLSKNVGRREINWIRCSILF